MFVKFVETDIFVQRKKDELCLKNVIFNFTVLSGCNDMGMSDQQKEQQFEVFET